jgi:lactose/L-arabinose transport system substrate-binding protein
VDISQFAQFKLDVGNVNGQNYGVPFDNGATGFFLRRDLVEQAGLQVSDFNDITRNRMIELGKIVRQRIGLPLFSVVAGGGGIVQL